MGPDDEETEDLNAEEEEDEDEDEDSDDFKKDDGEDELDYPLWEPDDTSKT